MKCVNCGQTFGSWMHRPIRCGCGAIYDDNLGSTTIILPSDNEIKRATSLKSRPKDKQQFSFLNIDKYREHWCKLHKYALDNKDNWDSQKTITWLSHWERTIPDFGCSCAQGWQRVRAEVVPNSSSPEEFFKWTVEVHNKVNKKLNKPIITYEEACKIHGF